MIKEIVRNKMVAAMKAKDEKQKTVYKYLLDQLMKAEKAKQTAANPNPVLSEDEEVAVIQSLIKQTKGGIDKTMAEATKKGIDPSDLAAFVEEREFELKLYSEFVPQLLTDYDEIKEAVFAILSEYGPLDALSSKSNRGTVMKIVAPAMKGKADMSVVNRVVSELLT